MGFIENQEIQFSNAITLLRSPLTFLVVFIHTFVIGVPQIDGIVHVPKGKYPVLDLIDYAVRLSIADIAVPMFFAISGYLFFWHCDVFDRQTYFSKIRKRFKTLVIPYIFWNLLYFGYILLTQNMLPSANTPDRKMIADYTVIDFLDSFWHYDGVVRGGAPIHVPMWFLRNLICVCLCSPLIFWFVKVKRLLPLAILGVLYVLGILEHNPGTDSVAFFFFSLGAWYSINGVYPTGQGKICIYILIVSFVLLFVDVLFWMNVSTNLYLHRLFITFGVASFAIISIRISKHFIANNTLKYLAGCSFFIFAFHFFLTPILNKCWILCLQPDNGITSFIAWLLIPIIASGTCVLVYACMKKLFPSLTLILVGGR